MGDSRQSSGGAIVERGDGLLVRQGRINTRVAHENAMLQKLIAEVIQTALGNGMHSGGMIAVRRTGGGASYVLLVTPLRVHGYDLGGPRPAAAVFIGDPEQPTEQGRGALAGRLSQQKRAKSLIIGRGDEIRTRDDLHPMKLADGP